MKTILLFLNLPLLLFGFSDNIKTFSADFEQRITDENKQVISYEGHVWAERDNKALWEYRTPISKKVYIENRDVKIVEEDLEQVIIKKLGQDIDFFKLLKQAKQITPNTYKADYGDNTYEISLKQGKISGIRYIDVFANSVEILFSKQVRNQAIDKKIFHYDIPEDFDILRE